MEEEFRIGVITQAHGVKGEVKIYPTTTDINRFKKLKKCVLKTEKIRLELEVAGAKFFKNMVILKFKAYNTRDEIEAFKGAELWVDRENADTLKDGEYFFSDLIGMKVISDEGEEIGIINDVYETAANDVYEIKGKEKTYLFPGIKECVLNIDLQNKIMTVHVLKGLLDL